MELTLDQVGPPAGTGLIRRYALAPDVITSQRELRRMPELPEVETVVRGLRRSIVGRAILSVRLGKTDFVDDPAALLRDLPGSRIQAVIRHGKYMLVQLIRKPGDGARSSLLVHLGMTGQLTSRRPDYPVAPHTHALFLLDDDRELRYTDIRRFGRLALLSDEELSGFLARLGLDPLEASLEQFCGQIAKRRARIKALLLDQRVFRGLGNIYADESLWRARTHPARQAARLGYEQLAGLYRAVRAILRDAIRLRGSSVSDYLDLEGQPGAYQRRHRVYDREGKPCYRCASLIRRVMVAGRSSYFCPRCQPAPRSFRSSRRAAKSA